VSDRFKFRAWNKDLQTWITAKYWMECQTDLDSIMTMLDIPDHIILMQSTGLKDKNGTLIFEGDILLSVEGEDEGYKWIVKYHDDWQCGFYLEFTTGGRQTMYSHYKREIIGNIHQNPELLESPKK